MFDGECPPTEDARGKGLARGLAELWFRHLFETVDDHGHTLSTRSFHLSWRGGMVHVEGHRQYPREALKKLRSWVQGNHRVPGLLEGLAQAHEHLIQEGVRHPVDIIMNLVQSFENGSRFLERVQTL
jgi:hypothetical protein